MLEYPQEETMDIMPSTFAEFWSMYGTAIGFFAGWLAAGTALDLVLTILVRNAARRHHSRVGEEFSHSMRGIFTLFGGMIGTWFAYYKTPLPAKINRDLSIYLKIGSIVLLTIYTARIIGHMVNSYANRDDTRLPASSIFINMVKALIYILGFSAILGVLGISLAPILTALGVGGLAVSLALQGTLDNLFSGIQIIASHQLIPGDYVRLDTGSEGTIEDVTWRNTTLRTATGELIIVPNATLGRSPVANYSRGSSFYKMVIVTTVGYGAEPARVEDIALSVARRVMQDSPDAYKEGEPTVRFTASSLAGIEFNTIIPVIDYTEHWEIKSVFIEKLQEALEAAHIPGPQPIATAPGTEKK